MLTTCDGCGCECHENIDHPNLCVDCFMVAELEASEGPLTDDTREHLAVLSAIEGTRPYATTLRVLLELSDSGYVAAAINVGYRNDGWILTHDGKRRLNVLRRKVRKETQITED